LWLAYKDLSSIAGFAPCLILIAISSISWFARGGQVAAKRRVESRSASRFIRIYVFDLCKPRPKQISAPIETGQGKVFEKCVREAQFCALGFPGNRRRGNAVKKLAEMLPAEFIGYKLARSWKVKMEIPRETPRNHL
jgi:hypothetical protein